TRGRVTRRQHRDLGPQHQQLSVLAAELRASSPSHRSTWQNSRYSSRKVMDRSSWPDCVSGESAAQDPRPTFWHPQVDGWSHPAMLPARPDHVTGRGESLYRTYAVEDLAGRRV